MDVSIPVKTQFHAFGGYSIKYFEPNKRSILKIDFVSSWRFYPFQWITNIENRQYSAQTNFILFKVHEYSHASLNDGDTFWEMLL